ASSARLPRLTRDFLIHTLCGETGFEWWLRVGGSRGPLWTDRGRPQPLPRGREALPGDATPDLADPETTNGAPPGGCAVRREAGYLAATTSSVSAASTSLR